MITGFFSMFPFLQKKALSAASESERETIYFRASICPIYVVTDSAIN